MPPHHDWVELGDAGPVVVDLRRRLRDLGFDSEDASRGGTEFDEADQRALRDFQETRGLDADGRCGPQTWIALGEASHVLGSRLLCLTNPMLRGDDVAELQLRLGALGFDTGRTDGIFGPVTSTALGEFQRNVGIVTDHICGPETLAQLRRMVSRGSTMSVAGLREHEESQRLGSLQGVRVAICHVADSELLAGRVGADLSGLGAAAAVMSAPDWPAAAAAINQFDSAVALAITVVDDPCCELAFYRTEGFRSVGGEHLARLLARQLPGHPGRALPVLQGRRLPILRETRCPTVRWRVGPPGTVDSTSGQLAAAVARAFEAWVTTEPSSELGQPSQRSTSD